MVNIQQKKIKSSALKTTQKVKGVYRAFLLRKVIFLKIKKTKERKYYSMSMEVKHKKLKDWVNEVAKMCQP
ncbi:MAG: hypothetical protein N2053_13180, partial [Chitinispirillaceae bacterium]|nr:hypothetical protein [Chitinispirillaceae bacterium]